MLEKRPGTTHDRALSIFVMMLWRIGLAIAALVLLVPLHAAGDAASDAFGEALARAALERTGHDVTYDGAYVSIAYPGGDVPASKGVCTDVVIRAYRGLGIDLQVEVHEEMSAHFDAFPARWGLSRPDSNIDHRRVPNLRTLFERKGESLPVTDVPEDYRSGDIVTWLVGGSGKP